MKILLTGSSGYLGTLLAIQLLEKGHTLFCLDKDKSEVLAESDNLTIIDTDLTNTDYSWIMKIPKDLDAVIHCAGVNNSFDIKKFYKNNSFATKRLIEELSIRYQSIKFIYISSISAIGPSTKKGLSEAHPPNPKTEYGNSKYLSEIYIQDNSPQSWQKIILRPGLVIGKDNPLLNHIFKLAKRGYYLFPGTKSRKNMFSFVSESDFLNVTLDALNLNSQLNKFDVYNVGHPKAAKLGSFYDKIHQLSGNTNIPVRLFCPKWLLFSFTLLFFVFNRITANKIKVGLTPDRFFELIEPYLFFQSEKSVTKLKSVYEQDLKKSVAECFPSTKAELFN